MTQTTFYMIIGGAVLLVIVLGLPGAYIMWRMIYKTMLKPSMNKNKILNSGISALAEIISLRQTGTMINFNPQVEISLKIYYPEGLEYSATATQVLPLVEIPKYVPGTQVIVGIDRDDKNNVLIQGLKS